MRIQPHPQPRTPEVRAASRAVAWTALAASLFLAGTYLAPWMEAAGHPAGRLVHWLYSPLCHQLPERSFEFFGAPLTVCARCTGLYWGGWLGLVMAVGLVARRRLQVRPVWLAFAAAPTVVDALLPWVGLTGLPSLPRFLLALAPGLVAGLFLAAGVEDLVLVLMSRRERNALWLRLRGAPVLEETDG